MPIICKIKRLVYFSLLIHSVNVFFLPEIYDTCSENAKYTLRKTCSRFFFFSDNICSELRSVFIVLYALCQGADKFRRDNKTSNCGNAKEVCAAIYFFFISGCIYRSEFQLHDNDKILFCIYKILSQTN